MMPRVCTAGLTTTRASATGYVCTSGIITPELG